MSSTQLLRQCTSLLSSRNLARPSLAAGRRLAAARAYSEAAAEPPKDGSAPSGQDAPPPSSESPEAAKLRAKEEEVTDLTGRLRYLQADFLNLQRNAAREKEQTRDFAISRFAADLLETVDVLGLALKSVPPSAIAPSLDSSHPPAPAPPASGDAPASAAPSSETKPAEAYLTELYTGVEATQRLLLSTLFKYQIKPFDPTGDKFDPNRHEALYQAPIPGKEPGSVIDCQTMGYTIKDRVLRAAKVGVAAETS